MATILAVCISPAALAVICETDPPDCTNVCKLPVCNHTTGSWACSGNASTSTSCDDGSACTTGDHCNGAGVCVGTPVMMQGYKVNSQAAAFDPGATVSIAPTGSSCQAPASSSANPFFLAASLSTTYSVGATAISPYYISTSNCDTSNCNDPSTYTWMNGAARISSNASGATNVRVMYNAPVNIEGIRVDENAVAIPNWTGDDPNPDVIPDAEVTSAPSGGYPSDHQLGGWNPFVLTVPGNLAVGVATWRPDHYAVKFANCATSDCSNPASYIPAAAGTIACPLGQPSCFAFCIDGKNCPGFTITTPVSGTAHVNIMYTALHLVVSPGGTVTPGVATTVTVSVQDPESRTYDAYYGLMSLQFSDGTAPLTYQFVAGDHGSHSFTHTFTSAATTITAVDVTNVSPFASQGSVLFNPPALTEHFCPGNTVCARGQFPDGSWRPYAPTSPFNVPVAYPPVRIARTSCMTPSAIPGTSTCSDEIRQSVFAGASSAQPGNIITPTDGSGGWPTYYSTAADPMFLISCNGFFPAPACDLQTKSIAFHIPPGATRQLNSNDHHLTVIDQTTNTEYDLWHVFLPDTTPVPTIGSTIQTDYSGFIPIDTTSAQGYVIPGTTLGESTDSRFGSLAGRVRIEELNAAIASHTFINHALTISTKCTAPRTNTVFPADPAHTLATLCSGIANPALMGMRFHLNMGTGSAAGDIAAINAMTSIPEWKRVFLRTLIQYGALVNDAGTSFYFDFQIEGGNQYTTMGQPDRWLAFGLGFGDPGSQDWFNDSSTGVRRGTWANTDDSINWNTTIWNHLEVLDPCVSSNNCPATPPTP